MSEICDNSQDLAAIALLKEVGAIDQLYMNDPVGAISLAATKWEALPYTVKGNDVIGISFKQHKITPSYGYFLSQYKTHLFYEGMSK